MLRSLILVPLFNILIFIYAILPGHDLGVTVILFTLLIRFALWPLLKKQIHQQKALRELQPELKKIKKKAKGDRQKEAAMTMELYKEREINPFSSLGTLIVQLPILFTLFIMLRALLSVETPAALAELLQQDLYTFVANLSFVQEIINNPVLFDTTFLGAIDLAESSLLLAGIAALGQFAQSRVLQPKDKDAKKLRDILSDAKDGKDVDQSEQNAAMMRSVSTFFPILTFVFAYNLPSALALYWATSSLTAALQQKVALGHEVEWLSAFRGNGNGNGDETDEDNSKKTKNTKEKDTKKATSKKSASKKSKKGS